MNAKNISGLALIAMAIVSTGCAAPATMDPTSPPATTAPTASPTSPTGPITLQYIGHSCTLITAPDGTRIVSDPYGGGGGHPSGLADLPENLTAEVVTVSHFHPDHANVQAVNGQPKIIIKPEFYMAGMVKITGYAGDHGLIDGRSSGENTVFVFEIGDVKIVHLGAAGVVTQSDILAAMENADVVVLDIMGDAAHPLKDELDQLRERNARTIIPTHYSFDGRPVYYGSVTLDAFLQIIPSDLAVVRQGSILRVTTNMTKQVMVLAPSANESR
jgi:L-ascorbate metabolism protein UlaG (beta-lactamase superfamily)